MPEFGLNSEVLGDLTIWSDVCIPVHEPEVGTYHRPGDFYYRPTVVIDNTIQYNTIHLRD